MYIKCLATSVLFLSLHVFAAVSVETKNQSEDELKIKNDLESLQAEYDLSAWIYTHKVEVDENARTPRSHPVLTMSTQEEYLNNRIKLLSIFLHEQFHWYVIKHGTLSKGKFRKKIKAVFPQVKFELPLGSGTEGGTLSHIVVCYLEYLALSTLVGNERAVQTLSTNEYYTWVYDTILDPDNKSKLDKLIRQTGLAF